MTDESVDWKEIKESMQRIQASLSYAQNSLLTLISTVSRSLDQVIRLADSLEVADPQPEDRVEVRDMTGKVLRTNPKQPLGRDLLEPLSRAACGRSDPHGSHGYLQGLTGTPRVCAGHLWG